MIEYLIISFVIAKFLERGAVDVVSMVTGKEPPSLAYRSAKKPDGDKGPLAKAVSAWWADAVEDVDEKRRLKRLRTKEERDEAEARRRADRQKTIDDARPAPEEIPVEEAPAVEEFTPDGEPTPLPWPEDSDDERDRRRREWDERQEENERQQGEPTPIPWPNEPPVVEIDPHGERRPDKWDRPPINDDDWNRAVEEEPTGPAVDDNPTPVDTEPLVAEEPPAAPAEAPVADFPAGPQVEDFAPVPAEGAPAAVAEPITDDTEWRPLHPAGPHLTMVVDNTKEEGTMTTQNTQTQSTGAVEGGIGTHIRWTEATATYQDAAKAAVEMVGGQMAQSQNGPAVLALIAEIQEAHDLLKARYNRLNGMLNHHRQTVGEAYRATGGQAGNKEYVQGE